MDLLEKGNLDFHASCQETKGGSVFFFTSDSHSALDYSVSFKSMTSPKSKRIQVSRIFSVFMVPIFSGGNQIKNQEKNCFN